MAAASIVAEIPKLTELSPMPEFIQHRQTLWDSAKNRYEAEVQAKTPEPITIKTFGKVFEFESSVIFGDY